jgi:HTH-type transcriptional regulator / antitoxin HigA
MEGFNKSINNEAQYERALARIFRLMHQKLKRNAPEKRELETLYVMVDDYEQKYYPHISAL